MTHLTFEYFGGGGRDSGMLTAVALLTGEDGACCGCISSW